MNCQFAFALLTVVVTVPGLVHGALDPAKELLIDSLIRDAFISAQNVTGMGLSIVQDNEVVYSKGFGHQNIENNVLATPNSLFEIGSTTKSFAACIIVKTLHEKWPELGVSVLDKPIAELTPDFGFSLSDRYRAQYVSFRDLLSHRSCLRSPDLDLLYEPVSREEYIFRTRYQTEICDFRTGFVYNNAMFSLVGELIAHIAGSTIEQMVMEFTQQIGMRNATYIDVDELYLDNPNFSTPYYMRDGQIYAYDTALVTRVHIALTAGGLLASVTDMAAYINFHLNQGRFEGTQVIPADVMAWLYKSANPREFQARESETDRTILSYGYGLGLELQLFDGYKVVNHGGYWPPYHSGMTFIPARNTGIFSSTNGIGAFIVGLTHDGIHAAIYDILGDTLTDLNPSSLAKYYTRRKVGSSESIAHAELQQLKRSPMTNEDKKFIESLRKINGVRARVAPEDLLGSYGNANSGEMRILFDPQEGWFQMEFGEFGRGRLNAKEGSETEFEVEWLTTIDQHYYTYTPIELFPVPVVELDFSVVNTVLFKLDEGSIYVFIKDKTLDSEFAIPWLPGTCGPVSV